MNRYITYHLVKLYESRLFYIFIKALEHIGNIEMRLQGYLQHLNSKNKVKVPLSVEGQVNQLIAEATSVDNLCQM